MNMESFTLLVFIGLIFSCSSSETKIITNKLGNHSIEILPDWDYKFEKTSTRIGKTKYYGTQYVTGTLLISEGLSEYNTLDETFETYLSQFPNAFKDFKKISEGKTEINGLTSRWFRMTDNDNGTIYTTVQYVIQQKGKVSYSLNCSATRDTFKDFEEDFNKMVFSYKRLD